MGGGQLAKSCQSATLVTLLISDVVGDPVDTIASGPTVPDDDECTFAYCHEIIEKYKLHDKLPASVRKTLDDGGKGLLEDTPKSTHPAFEKSIVQIAASNEVAVDACIAKAKELGFNTLPLSSFMEGEATELAKAYIGIAKEMHRNDRPVNRPAVIVGGGESTVSLPEDHGLGGRSQALALAALVGIDGIPGCAILAGGTDGGDGPCDAAGAVVCGGDADLARARGIDAETYLRRADAYNFFKTFESKVYGEGINNIVHLRDGPTGTNVMDLVIMVVMHPEGKAAKQLQRTLSRHSISHRRARSSVMSALDAALFDK